MDRGAARSRKREEKLLKQKEKVKIEAAAEAAPAESSRAVKGGGKGKGKNNNKKDNSDDEAAGSGDESGKKTVHPDRRQDPNPELYKSKAIRSARALVYSQAAFELPVPAERLAGVTRVDLEGSGCTDVSWLAGSGVTWLSVKGCPIEKGWDAVGSLEGLAVLNISACGLSKLPKELAGLTKLKAVVAMNNEWTKLDPEVVAAWGDLNSLIVSHSPALTSLPTTLSTLPHLAKLTLSHCPRLDAAGLPDLSALPLLRDIRANNLPRLASLPVHLATWGTGSLALVGKDKEGKDRKGDGLEVLDVGNCSLPYAAVEKAFSLGPSVGRPKTTWHLRMLTLQANPLTLEEPKYAELLQASAALPRLQIIDSKRVVERKNAGAAPETKAERRVRERAEGRVQRKMKPTGANAGKQKMREWGTKAGGEGEGGDEGEGEDVEMQEEDGAPERKRERVDGDKPEKRRREDAGDRKKGKFDKSAKPRFDEHEKREKRAPKDDKKRKERFFEADEDEVPIKSAPAAAPVAKAAAPAPTPTPKAAPAPVVAEPEKKKRKRKHAKSSGADAAPAAPAPTTTRPAAATTSAAAPAPMVKADPSALPTSANPKKPGKSQTAVVGVVDVSKPKSGGVDLKSMFGGIGGKKEDKGDDSGLGVGGW